MVIRPIVILFVLCANPALLQGQKLPGPTVRRTDLVEHTDRVWQNGDLSTVRLDQYLKDTSRYQVVKIESKFPAFSWVLNDDRRGVSQKSYRIIVASDLKNIENNKGDVWDSKVVVSAKSTAVSYRGPALKPGHVYYWKVRVSTSRGGQSSYSKYNSFVTGSHLKDYATPFYPLQKKQQLPVVIKQPAVHYYLADFGKDAFGQLQLILESDKGGDSVTVELGEALDSSGWIHSRPGGTIRYAKYKIGLQRGRHTYPIKFKSDKRNTGVAAIKMPAYIGEVLPFRYVAISNYIKVVSKRDIMRTMVHYHFNEQASLFTSSDSILNKIWDLCKHTMQATSFAGIYVDGDRERIPYEADAFINQLSHYAVDNEYSLARRSHEYLLTHATWPTEWILQSVLMAWNDYQYTGDARSMEKYYTDLKAKLLVPLAREDGLISSRTGKQDKSLMEAIYFNGKQIRDIVDWPTSETDGFVFSDINTVVNAYHYHALVLMERMARTLGKKADADSLGRRAGLVKKTFQEKLFDPSTGLVVDGEGTNHSSLHANMFALAFDLVPAEKLSRVLDFIRSRGKACSVYGAQFLMDAVYKAGADDYALALLTATGERSWYNMLREGATMAMEAWGNKFKPNQDWNHAWGAVPANIIMSKLVGIECTKAGFEEVNIKPQLADLSFITARFPTIKGDILIDIKNDPGNYQMKVDIPVNTRANIYLPKKYLGKTVFLNGKRTPITERDNACFIGNIGSGHYSIKVLSEFP